jgi:hypothetical protein
VRTEKLDRLTDHRAAEAGLQPALVAGVIDTGARVVRYFGAALRDRRDRGFGVARQRFGLFAAADEAAERAISRADAVEVPPSSST